jgi:hypothetical protein
VKAGITEIESHRIEGGIMKPVQDTVMIMSMSSGVMLAFAR